jgi:myotubularin-related protein 6/7/8
MVVPSKISDTVIAYACKYRSKGRIPALSYLHWANHVGLRERNGNCSGKLIPYPILQASITRCSQPLVGLKNNRSNQDERLIEAIFSSHVSPDTAYAPPSGEYGGGYGLQASGSSKAISTSDSAGTVYGATATNLIVDARPTANAMANVATGAGTENMEYYKMARKTYLGIENIHVMRDSLKKVETALQRADQTGMMDRHLLRRSNWLKHISAILDGALIIVRNVHINSSHVLIHCSDGWDRTSQLSALAQVCLDPYFRTIKGFQVLIEKDWVSFGHKFMDRCGHLSPDKLDLNSAIKPEDEEEERGEAAKAAQAFFGAFQKQFTPSSHHVKETSPVFHQFLDCVRQMQRQYPERFEYNSKYLEDLYYHLYSCQFGTFISNTERQRKTPGGIDDDNASLLVASKPPICERTVSIWDFAATNVDAYKNASYDATLDNPTGDGDMGVLLPNPKDVRFWSELFKRGDEEMNGARQVLQEQAQGVEVLGPIGRSERDPVVDQAPATVAKAAAILGTGGQASASEFSATTGSIPRSESPARRDTADSWHNVEASAIPAAPARRKVETSYASGSQSPSSRTRAGGSGSWGWSNFSTGALTVLQGAAKELSGAAKDIRTIGADAYTNFAANPERTPRNSTFDAWDRPSVHTNPASSSLHTNGGWPERRPTNRTVSESNPWAAPDTPISAGATASGQTSAVDKPAVDPDAISYMRSPSETWGSIADRRDRTGPSAGLETKLAEMSVTAAVPHKDYKQPEVSSSSSWDPLGAM